MRRWMGKLESGKSQLLGHPRRIVGASAPGGLQKKGTILRGTELWVGLMRRMRLFVGGFEMDNVMR